MRRIYSKTRANLTPAAPSRVDAPSCVAYRSLSRQAVNVCRPGRLAVRGRVLARVLVHTRPPQIPLGGARLGVEQHISFGTDAESGIKFRRSCTTSLILATRDGCALDSELSTRSGRRSCNLVTASAPSTSRVPSEATGQTSESCAVSRTSARIRAPTHVKCGVLRYVYPTSCCLSLCRGAGCSDLETDSVSIAANNEIAV